MAFNCDFNAPMFVDLLNQDMDTNPEDYFEIDHEAQAEARAMFDAPSPDDQAENVSLDGQVQDSATGATSDNPTTPTRPMTSSPEAESTPTTSGSDPDETKENDDQKKPPAPRLVSSWSSNVQRPETPTRKALRQAVAETIAAVANSPKMQLPERVKQPKRLGTNLGNQPRLNSKVEAKSHEPAGSKSSAALSASPAVGKWRKAVSQMTPEVFRQARAALQKRKLTTTSGNDKEAADNSVANTFKEQLKARRMLGSSKTDPSLPVKAAAPLPVVKPLHPTNPQPFTFATDARIKSAAAAAKGSESSEAAGSVDFGKMLRSYKANTSVSSTKSSSTQVKPFSFCSNSSAPRRARSVEPSPSGKSRFVSTAELVKKFQTGTPDRFRSMPRGRSSSAGLSNRRRSPSPQLTQARTPNLLTRGRSRPVHVLSQEEREELELAEARKNQIRAHAINEGVPPPKPVHVEKRPPTVAEPFQFSTIPTRSRSAQLDEPPAADFHAKPAPKKIFEKPVGIPEKQSLPLVVPQSPAFALKDRLKDRKRPAPAEPTAEEESAERIIRARPVPHFGVPVIMQNASKRVTQAEPFSFWDRDKALLEKKQQKMMEAEEEDKKAREFKAKPVPDLNKPIGLPIKEVVLPTKQEPFEFQIERRVGERLQKWQEDLEKELEEQRKAACFRAKPCTVLEKEPFIPKPSDKPLARIEDFELHSDRRAKEREEFEMQRKQKEAEMESMKRQLEEKRQREEEAEIQRLRRELTHKAQPVKHYRSIEIQPSDKALTKPVSPKFSSLARSRRQTNSSSGSSHELNGEQPF